MGSGLSCTKGAVSRSESHALTDICRPSSFMVRYQHQPRHPSMALGMPFPTSLHLAQQDSKNGLEPSASILYILSVSLSSLCIRRHICRSLFPRHPEPSSSSIATGIMWQSELPKALLDRTATVETVASKHQKRQNIHDLRRHCSTPFLFWPSVQPTRRAELIMRPGAEKAAAVGTGTIRGRRQPPRRPPTLPGRFRRRASYRNQA